MKTNVAGFVSSIEEPMQDDGGDGELALRRSPSLRLSRPPYCRPRQLPLASPRELNCLPSGTSGLAARAAALAAFVGAAAPAFAMKIWPAPRGRTTIDCWQSEIEVSLPHEQRQSGDQSLRTGKSVASVTCLWCGQPKKLFSGRLVAILKAVLSGIAFLVKRGRTNAGH